MSEGGREGGRKYFLPGRGQSPPGNINKLGGIEVIRVRNILLITNYKLQSPSSPSQHARPGSGLSMCRSVSQSITNNFPALLPHHGTGSVVVSGVVCSIFKRKPQLSAAIVVKCWVW